MIKFYANDQLVRIGGQNNKMSRKPCLSIEALNPYSFTRGMNLYSIPKTYKSAFPLTKWNLNRAG